MIILQNSANNFCTIKAFTFCGKCDNQQSDTLKQLDPFSRFHLNPDTLIMRKIQDFLNVNVKRCMRWLFTDKSSHH